MVASWALFSKIFLASIIAFISCIFLMSLGYLLSRKVIKGSCGGLSAGPCGRCGKGKGADELRDPQACDVV